MGETIATNKKAFRDFELLNKWECGIELKGSEVKSIRAGHVSFKDTFARVDDGEIMLYSLHIEPYKQASYENVDPDRIRRLLLHKREVRKIENDVTLKNYTLIPTKLYYNKRGFVKVELAMGKGRKFYDKREVIKKRQIARDLNRAIRSGSKSRR